MRWVEITTEVRLRSPVQRATLRHAPHPVVPAVLRDRGELALRGVDAAHEHAHPRELGAVGAQQPLLKIEALPAGILAQQRDLLGVRVGLGSGSG